MKNRKAVGLVIKMVHQLSPSFLPILIVQKLIQTSVPYVDIVFGSRIIDRMLQKQSLGVVLTDVLWMISLNCILNIIGWGLDKLVNIRRYVMSDQVQAMITEKALTLDYELLEKKETLEYIEKARDGMKSNGDIGQFCMTLAGVIGIIVDIIYSAVLFFPVFVPGETVGDSFLYRFYSSPWSGSVISLFLIGQLLIWIWSSRRLAKLRKESFDINVEGNRRFSYFCSFLNDYAKGKDLRMYKLGKTILENYREGVCKLVENYDMMQKKMEKYSVINEWGGGVFALVTYVYTGMKAGIGMISIGNVSRYVGTFTKFSAALGQVVQVYTTIVLQSQYLSYFVEFMNIENRKYEGTLPVEKRDDNEYVFEFKDVSFRYPNSKEPVLDHVSLKLRVGRKLAVVGPNGAGKTTFIKLLCRLYDPMEGQILLNGIDIRYYDYDEYIQLFSVVFQDFKLFSFSIADNVAVGREYEEEQVKACLHKAGFSERLTELEEGIDTRLYQLEENGVEISGGEAQKIAIARALYRDSPLVILDEPTSALDPVSEYEIYKSFDELVDEKTAIYISHRMSSCRFCNQILVFDKGRIVQKGGHEELLQDEDGLYARMWNSQAGYYR